MLSCKLIYILRYVVSQFVKPKPPHQYWEEETSQSLVPENRNCLLCESQDSGACRAMPSCVYCEPTVTALCERSTPCLRCTGQWKSYLEHTITSSHLRVREAERHVTEPRGESYDCCCSSDKESVLQVCSWREVHGRV